MIGENYENQKKKFKKKNSYRYDDDIDDNGSYGNAGYGSYENSNEYYH